MRETFTEDSPVVARLQTPAGSPIWWIVPVILSITMGYGLLAARTGEVFPFAPWNMYSRVPCHDEYHALRIHRLGSEEYDPPRWARDVPALAESVKSAALTALVKEFGYQLAGAARGDLNARARAEEIRASVEGRLFKKPAVYDVIYLAGNPLKVQREGAYDVMRVVATLEASGIRKVPR